jgi:hypothetical protein
VARRLIKPHSLASRGSEKGGLVELNKHDMSGKHEFSVELEIEMG